MRTSVRLWRTEKPGELVLDSDPKAVVLAYGQDDEVSADDQAAAEKLQPKAANKQADPPADKQADPPPNKAGAKRPSRRPSRPPAKKAATSPGKD